MTKFAFGLDISEWLNPMPSTGINGQQDPSSRHPGRVDYDLPSCLPSAA